MKASTTNDKISKSKVSITGRSIDLAGKIPYPKEKPSLPQIMSREELTQLDLAIFVRSLIDSNHLNLFTRQ